MTFVAATEKNYNEPSVVCPCINPRDPHIQRVPESIGAHYSCETAAISHKYSLKNKEDFFFPIILCGMELVMGIGMHVVPSTILHGSTGAV